MWNEVWGSHIVTADAQTQKKTITVAVHLCSAYYALQCACVCVYALHLMVFENGLWHVEGRRTQCWIILFAAHIRFSCFLFVIWQDTFSCLLSPVSYCLVSFSHIIDLIWTADVEKEEKEGGEGVVVEWLSFWAWVWNHYLLFRGCCCSEAAGWRALPAVPNWNWEHDALIKNPMKALTHKQNPHLL